MKPVIVHNLSKSYGNTESLKGISFEVENGEIFGFIGPDGAGKTTLFRILTTLLNPDSGRAEVLGMDTTKDYRKLRQRLGYMPGRFSLYLDLSVEENLEFFASVFGADVEANYALIEPIFRQLEPFRARLAGDLSGGMKQKLALSCALIHRPDILVLDEPTTGVDAVSRKEFWDMLHSIREEGITILVSTPYMDEASKCDRVALVDEGTLLQTAAPGQIVDSYDRNIWAVRSNNRYSLIQALRDYPGTRTVHPFGEYVHITMEDDRLDTGKLTGVLSKRSFQDVRVEPVKPGIEDVFMDLMSQKTVEGL